MKVKMLEEAFLPLLVLKNSAFSILLKYLLVEGRTGIKPSTGDNESLISKFFTLLALSTLASRVTNLEWISHPVIYLFFP
jgi:hypothetical protein